MPEILKSESILKRKLRSIIQQKIRNIQYSLYKYHLAFFSQIVNKSFPFAIFHDPNIIRY